jgi:ketosteroid isomerase-like protein
MSCASFEDAVARHHQALAAFMRRDTQAFKDLYSRQDDATLANPFGGVARGWGEIPQRVDLAASYYEDGEVVSIETISSNHSDEFGYCFEVELLRGRLGKRDVIDEVGLRTTSVFRCEDGDWRLVHRHADPAIELRVPESIV